MTRRTTRQIPYGPNIVLRRKQLAFFFLVRSGLPIHIENIFLLAQILFRRTMAIEAPLHLQRVGLEHQRHLIHLPVTRRAADALVHVNAVIEIDVIRQAMHFNPLNRGIRAVALAHRGKITHIVEQHRMAIHAGFRRRDARGRGSFHARVAIPAVDPVITRVMLVTELDGLIARQILIGKIGGAHAAKDHRQSQRCKDHNREEADPSGGISTSVKKLGHVSFSFCRPARRCNFGGCGLRHRRSVSAFDRL